MRRFSVCVRQRAEKAEQAEQDAATGGDKQPARCLGSGGRGVACGRQRRRKRQLGAMAVLRRRGEVQVLARHRKYRCAALGIGASDLAGRFRTAGVTSNCS
jgi:hypothetical protein